MEENLKFRELWPWSPPFLRLMLLTCTLLGLLATAFTYPFAGIHACWFLTAIPVGVVFRAIYGVVGGRVRELKRHSEALGGETAESLMAIGRLQSPGLVVLYHDKLLLMPIAGSQVSLPLSEIFQVVENRMLPGKFVWGKKAFHLATDRKVRIAFAVAESTGCRWSVKLRQSIAS